MKKRDSTLGSYLHDIILGGQDGMVNVLGVVLAIAAATNETRVIIIAGIAANLAESLSMASVAYTSTQAYNQYYYSELAREKKEIRDVPDEERREVRTIYRRKGFRGKLLDQIVAKITSSKKLWLDTMMTEELNLSVRQIGGPVQSAVVVGISALIGSTIPLLPFFFVSVKMGVVISLISSTLALFVTGAVKAKFTIGSWLKNGLEMALIGIITALLGYGIGLILGRVF
ncbi:VIT1/CCC1 transporter family protein [Candidatus Woesearchaeota archaeon]|nr:VIT1/CCC1 transporter family protein [Candidatus Woesearchaeota archaeon]